MEGQGEHHQEPREYRLVTPQESRESHKQAARIRREWRREERRRKARQAVAAIKAITVEELVALVLIVGGLVAHIRTESGWYLAMVAIGVLRMFWVAREASCGVMFLVGVIAASVTKNEWHLWVSVLAAFKLCFLSEFSRRS